METFKHPLPKKKLSKNKIINIDLKIDFVLKSMGFLKSDGSACNPSKIISMAWRKA
jgi:hypothetical protein